MTQRKKPLSADQSQAVGGPMELTARRRGKAGCYSWCSVSQEAPGHTEMHRVQVPKQGPATAARSLPIKHIQALCPLKAITRSWYLGCATVLTLPTASLWQA